MKMRRACRLWWPKELLSSKESPSSFVLGWFITSSSVSLDIIVAFTCSEVLSSQSSPGVKDIVHDTNGNMPIVLQNKSMFSILGHIVTDTRGNSLMVRPEDEGKSSNYDNDCAERSTSLNGGHFDSRNCGCLKLDGSLEQSRRASVGNGNWILLMFDPHERNDVGIPRLPKLHHFHWNGKIMSDYDVHVIIYEMPTYGSQHFSLCQSPSFKQVKTSIKKPKWVTDLGGKQKFIDLDEDTVILAINCTAAARRIFERHMAPWRSFSQLSIFHLFCAFIGHLFAKSIASFSTLFYAFLQLFQSIGTRIKNESESLMYIISAKVFRTTWISIHIHCSQILYWPIFLQDNDSRSRSCVQYAEKAAMHRHSIWSTLVVNVLLGNLVGLAVLYHAEFVCSSVLNFFHYVANTFLRSGCVWLMGNPAGFKLNTELARILGVVSLNAIQIWSTLWNSVDFIFIYIIKGLAILGILFGLTAPAALTIDMIALATFHLSSLHWFISILYSSQIQAIAALWRLFRGRKWNPLRQRLDSFDYTVKQHIVGSLLFTTLLLLLPTTSVFYIFFSIVDTTINLFCILIEFTISVIHATPYIKILLWLVRPGRFPSGIWFEILSCQSHPIVSPNVDCADEMTSLEKVLQLKNINRKISTILVSVCHSNCLSIGKVVLPHYRTILSGFSKSSVSGIAHGILIGRRLPSRRGTLLSLPMPWMSLPCKEYWCLCHDSLIALFR